MNKSTFGKLFTVTTWGESHGKALGAVVDGCPAGLELDESHIQKYLNRRKPGQSRYTTARKEGDQVEILSGVFEGKTTGTPISLMVRNMDQRSGDYGNIAYSYRPGHADFTFDSKYGFRDYRGGGRSSARETIGRVAAGAIAEKFLKALNISVCAYTRSIGPVEISSGPLAPGAEALKTAEENPLYMPDPEAAERAARYLEERMADQDSAGGVVECVVSGLPAGLGEPVFEKLDANLARAILSIGAVKGVEIGDGFAAARSRGSENNDGYRMAADGSVVKTANHSGGVLGGISDGSDLVFRAAFKPTPSISRSQETVSRAGENIELSIKGRHDPVVVPRAVVVVEAMAALTVMDMLLVSMSSRLDMIQLFFQVENAEGADIEEN